MFFQIIAYIRCSYFMKHWNQSASWAAQWVALPVLVAWKSPSPQGLATQRFIWNCLMHYLSNNQGSEFILQIIGAFVALMAKISQSSEPLTGCAFAGNNNNSVCKEQQCVRAQTRQKILKSAEEAPYSYATPINQVFFSRAAVFLHLTFDTYQQIGFQPPNSWSAHIK